MPALHLGGLLSRAARRESDRPALWAEGSYLTWRQLKGRVQERARLLAALGVGPGDRVAVVMPHRPETVETLWAIWWLGAVAVPLDPRLPQAEQRRRIEAVAARCLLTGPAPADAQVLCQGAKAGEPVRQRARSADPAVIIFTSGTTGSAKGAVLSHGALLASARQHLALSGVEEPDAWLASLPLFHVGGLGILVRSAMAAIPAALPEAFSAEVMADAIRRHRPSHISLVAQTLDRLLRGPEDGFPSLRLALVGGGPTPLGLLVEATRRGLPVATTYGLTETASQVAVLPPGSPPHLTGSAGWPLSLSQLRVDGDGRIWVRGRTLFSGYWQDEAASRQVLRDGWLLTGDIGRLGDDGELWVESRQDDLIISGGEKVSPREVEEVMVGCPGVREAAVFGHADPTWGQVPWALVVAEGACDPRAVIAYCQDRLTPYQLPRVVRVVPELPKGALGKIRRAELPALAEAAGAAP